jgi:hypothetical protein
MIAIMTGVVTAATLTVGIIKTGTTVAGVTSAAGVNMADMGMDDMIVAGAMRVVITTGRTTDIDGRRLCRHCRRFRGIGITFLNAQDAGRPL